MRSRLTKYFPIKPIYLAFLLLLIYFLIFSWTMAGLILLILALLSLLLQYDRKTIVKTLCCLTLFSLYFVFLNHQNKQREETAPEAVNQILIIPDSISVNGDYLSFHGKYEGQVYQVFYKLKSQQEKTFFQGLSQSLVLEVEAKTEEPSQQRNFQGFDYQKYLKSQGIHRLLQIDSISRMTAYRSQNIFERLQDWRRSAIVHIEQHFPAPMKHYLTGLLFGYLDKSFDEMTDIYSSLGIIHLFALSGMHVGFFLKIFRFLFLRMGLRRDYVDILQVPFSFCYAGLTGFSVSVVRSLTQSFFTKLGIKGLDNLALTVMTLFVVMPRFLLTTGGVLSFSYAFILSLVSFEELTALRRKIVESLALSFGILPVLIYFFAVFQPASMILTAILSLVFDSLLLPLLVLVFCLSPFIVLTSPNLIFELLESCLRWTNSILTGPLIFGKPSLLIFLLLLFFSGLLYDCYSRKKLALILSLVLALLFFMVKHPLENEVTVVDVGQGDSIFLRDVKGKTILIDVGGKVTFGRGQVWQERVTDSNAERTLIPYLKSRGVSKIDQLVLTHTDADHMGDMEELAKHFAIGEILVSQGSLTKADFVDRLEKMRVKLRLATAGDSLPIMGSQLQVLYPSQIGDGGNNDSIVLYGRLLATNFLFTGDLEEGELDLIESYPNLPVDVLKAGHHGSKGSSYPEFLSHIQPSIALISAGQNNRYQHPHQETLDRFEQAQMTVYRTDQQGAIRFRGLKEWTVETVR